MILTHKVSVLSPGNTVQDKSYMDSVGLENGLFHIQFPKYFNRGMLWYFFNILEQCICISLSIAQDTDINESLILIGLIYLNFI